MKDTTIKQLETEGWQGSDLCLAISLFEYGLVWRVTETEIEFIHRLDRGHTPYHYNRCSYPLTTDVYKEWNWVYWDALFNCQGTSQEEYDAESLAYKIFDLFRYYGDEEIFGTVYYKGAKVPDEENPYPEETEDASDS